MNKPRHTFSLALVLLTILAGATIAKAQTDPVSQIEPSYEVALHIVIGSDDPATKGELPANLSNLSKQLKGNFPFSNYRLANTFLGRISNTGTVEYKSVSNIFGQETSAESRSFLEWSMTNFRAMPNGFQAKAFRFGAKVPVKTAEVRDSAGVVSPVIAYEPVGLTMYTVGLPANTPTLIGTISLPNTSGTIFLVATVRNPTM